MLMKRRLTTLAFLAVSCLYLSVTSCQEKTRLTKQEMEQLKLTPEEAQRFTPEMLEHRKASFILSEYVVLKDQQYVLEISAKEALEKKGISQELYDKVAKDLAATNTAINKALQEGQKLDLPHSFKDIL